MSLPPVQIHIYIAIFIVVMLVTFIASNVRERFRKEEDQEEYKLIQKYLLNASPLYGYNKPKLWIHSKYEVNSRVWRSFYSRNSTELNQSYIHLTVKTIINHCGNDFNICLIDDHTFSKLIPSWNIDVSALPDPLKTRARTLGMIQIIAIYGGMTIPNSFVCTKNLLELYESSVSTHGGSFVVENVNHSTLSKNDKHLAFVPDVMIMGARRDNHAIKDLVVYLKSSVADPHYHIQDTFTGDVSAWLYDSIEKGNMTLVGGEHIGVKTKNGKPILLEHLMEEEYLDLDPMACGILIPGEQILARNKYQWFAALKGDDVLKTNAVVVKYLTASIVDSSEPTVKWRDPDEEKNSNILPSAVTI